MKLPRCTLHKLRSLSYEADLRGVTHITAVYFGNERNNGLHFTECGHKKRFTIKTSELKETPLLALRKMMEEFIAEIVCRIG